MPVELNRAAKVTSLGNRPLAVVTAGKESQPGWHGHQQELTKLSSNGRQVIVADSTHRSLINHQADAGRSSQAIRDVVHASRKSGGRYVCEEADCPGLMADAPKAHAFVEPPVTTARDSSRDHAFKLLFAPGAHQRERIERPTAEGMRDAGGDGRDYLTGL